MRRTQRTLARLLVAAGLVGAACSVSQQHGYVQSSDGSLSFRHPVEWADVELLPVTAEWIAGIDGAQAPSADNASELVLDEPFVLAEVYPLESTSRDSITLRSLRQLALVSGEDPASGADPNVRLRFNHEISDEHGFEGHHMRFEIDVEGGTAVEEQLAVFDAQRRRVHRVRVVCSIACFETNGVVIGDIFESIRLRP